MCSDTEILKNRLKRVKNAKFFFVFCAKRGDFLFSSMIFCSKSQFPTLDTVLVHEIPVVTLASQQSNLLIYATVLVKTPLVTPL